MDKFLDSSANRFLQLETRHPRWRHFRKSADRLRTWLASAFSCFRILHYNACRACNGCEFSGSLQDFLKGKVGGTRYKGTRYKGTRYKGSKVQRYKGTKVQRYKGTKVQRYKGTKVQRYETRCTRCNMMYKEHDAIYQTCSVYLVLGTAGYRGLKETEQYCARKAIQAKVQGLVLKKFMKAQAQQYRYNVPRQGTARSVQCAKSSVHVCVCIA